MQAGQSDSARARCRIGSHQAVITDMARMGAIWGRKLPHMQGHVWRKDSRICHHWCNAIECGLFANCRIPKIRTRSTRETTLAIDSQGLSTTEKIVSVNQHASQMALNCDQEGRKEK